MTGGVMTASFVNNPAYRNTTARYQGLCLSIPVSSAFRRRGQKLHYAENFPVFKLKVPAGGVCLPQVSLPSLVLDFKYSSKRKIKLCNFIPQLCKQYKSRYLEDSI